MSISGYHLQEQITESSHSLVYRAYSEREHSTVVLKLPAEPVPTPERLARFQHEYDILHTLDAPGIIHCYRLEQVGHRPMLVLEDFGGSALNRTGLAGRLDLATFLHLAIASTTSLSQVHAAHIIHKDITPGNLVYHSHTRQLKLIDFSLSTRLPREAVAFQNPTVLEGTLAYMSPEQTGRMNRAVDYRTDLYSLGVTLYELLTGQCPFTTDDPLELVHAHLARQPHPPHHLCPHVPPALSNILLKLLAKDPEDRYQSAEGLLADLAYCWNHLDVLDRLQTFTPGQEDRSAQFQLPQRLYGRTEEVQHLTATFARVAAGERELLLVAGAAGIGKTVLVHELHPAVTARRGYFIEGKFDQYQRIPYLAWVQAFTELVMHFLTESESCLAAWRGTILSAVGDNGRVLTDVMPSLELIIGPQPPVPHLEGKDAQHRLEFVLQNFIRVLAQPEHPLVVFLDDLQWTDSASLKLLEQTLGGVGNQHLLVIGAYRDVEATPAHPLWNTLEMLQQAGIQPVTLTLGELNSTAVTELICDTLHVSAATAQPLAELLQQKTGGNPFFLSEFLKALYVEELLHFDHACGCWTWELPQIEARQMTDNVVELMTQQVQRLPEATQRVVQAAACIGSRFDLAILSAASEQTPAETARQLEPALLGGLVEPLTQDYKVVGQESAGSAVAMRAEYRFAHDRVQQAAYEQVPEGERAMRHRRIGQLLLASIPAAEQQAKIFQIVYQLNKGLSLLVESSERYELAALNLLAGQKARAATAYGAAWDYFTVGRQLLPTDSWHSHYDITLHVYEASVEAAYLGGDFATMENLAGVVLKEAHTLLDQVKVYEMKSQSLVAQNQLLEAVHTGLQFLASLGIELPQQPSQNDIFLALQETRTACEKTGIAELINLPLMTDPVQLAAMRVISSILAPSFLCSPELYALLTFKEVNLSITYGNTSISTHSYACYAMLLCGVVGDIEAGYQFGQLALDL